MSNKLQQLLDERKKLDELIEKAKKEALVGDFTEETEQFLNSSFISKEWMDLIRTVEYSVKETAKSGYASDDNMAHIAIEAMKAVYGKDMFDWYNKLY